MLIVHIHIDYLFKEQKSTSHRGSFAVCRMDMLVKMDGWLISDPTPTPCCLPLMISYTVLHSLWCRYCENLWTGFKQNPFHSSSANTAVYFLSHMTWTLELPKTSLQISISSRCSPVWCIMILGDKKHWLAQWVEIKHNIIWHYNDSEDHVLLRQ